MLPSYFTTRYLAKRTETFPYKDYLKKHIAATFVVVKNETNPNAHQLVNI